MPSRLPRWNSTPPRAVAGWALAALACCVAPRATTTTVTATAMTATAVTATAMTATAVTATVAPPAAREVTAAPEVSRVAPSTAPAARDDGDGPLPCEAPTLGCGADTVSLAAWARARGLRPTSGGDDACTADDAHDALYCLTGERVGGARWYRRVERLDVYVALRGRAVLRARVLLAMSIFDAVDVRPNLVLLRARPTAQGLVVDEDPRLPACDVARDAPGDPVDAMWARGDAAWRARVCASRGEYAWQGARWRRVARPAAP